MKVKMNIPKPSEMISKVTKTTKMVANKTNELALNTTETVVTEALDATAEWQIVTNNAIKAGFKLAAKQQDLIFDAMESVKDQVILSKKRLTKLIA